MNVVHGDIIDLAENGELDVIIHGCNCFCRMGAGLARAIRHAFPEAAEADRRTAKGDRRKLGTISVAEVQRAGRVVTVVNGYTQFHWAGSGRLVEYEAVRSVMREVKARFPGKRIGYPRIGAGLARGNWEVIARVIAAELAGEDHTLVEYSR